MLDRDGVLHMIYFKGDASAGDIEYVWRKASGEDFSPPIRVNSEPEGAVAVVPYEAADGRREKRAYLCDLVWCTSPVCRPDQQDAGALFPSQTIRTRHSSRSAT